MFFASFYAYSHMLASSSVFPCISCLLASPLLFHESYTHGSHSDRLSCFLSFSAAPIESYCIAGKTGKFSTAIFAECVTEDKVDLSGELEASTDIARME